MNNPNNDVPRAADLPDKKPSGQRLKRYHRRAARQRAQERSDARFYGAVFSLAGISAAIAIGLAVWAINGGEISSGLGALTRPWLGSTSKLEFMAVAFVIILGILYFVRTRAK